MLRFCLQSYICSGNDSHAPSLIHVLLYWLDAGKVSGRLKAFVTALWVTLPVEKFLLLVHLTPQKLAWKATAAKHPRCKLSILPVAPAWSFYLVLHLRQQICPLRGDMWRKEFLTVTRKWCLSNSFQTCSKEESLCKAERTKLGHILPKRRWFLSLIWSNSTETWLCFLKLSLGSYFLK